MAFHISGTPILGFSKKIENGDRGTIDLYRSYLELYGDDPYLDPLLRVSDLPLK